MTFLISLFFLIFSHSFPCLSTGHQFVLGALSPYFDSVFNEFHESESAESGNVKPKMVLVMRGCTSKTLEKLIDFMYKGPDELRDDSEDKEWNELYGLAEECEIYGLLESILEKRKLMKKDENGNVEMTLDGINVDDDMLKKLNGVLIDLEEFKPQDTTLDLTPIQILIDTYCDREKEMTKKGKWIKKAESKLGQIHR